MAKKRRRAEDDHLLCHICGKWLRSVNWLHLRIHDVTTEEYKKKYGVDFLLSDAARRNISRKLRRKAGTTKAEFFPRTKAEIVEDLHEIARLRSGSVGREWLKRNDPTLAKQAAYAFGTWAKALRAAGMEPCILRSWSKSAIRTELRTRHSKGLALNDNRVNAEDSALYSAALKHFGTWQAAVEAAGYDYGQIRQTKSRTKGDVVHALRDCAKRFGPLTGKLIRDYDPWLGQAAVRWFGSIEEAASKLELPFLNLRRSRSADWVKAQIRKRHREGRPLRAARVQEEERPLYYQALRHFSTWRNAMKAAGVDYAPYDGINFHGIKEVAEALRGWAGKHGGLSAAGLRKTAPALLSPIYRNFGSVKEAAKRLNLPFSPRHRRRTKPEVLVDARMRKKAGMPMDKMNVRASDRSLYRAAVKHFGSWKQVLEELKAGRRGN